jgi:hypothetical protein
MAFPQPKTFKNIIARYVESGAGRRTMAAKMTPSLRRYRDYSAVGRKAFLVEDLEDGALPLYDKDPIVPAYAVAEAGNSIQVLVDSQRVVAPLTILATLPMIPLSHIRERRYDSIKRSIELGVAGVKEKEDVRVFATMNSLAADPDNPHLDINVSAPLMADAISDAIGAIEEHGLRASRIFMNGLDYADIRKFDHDMIDPETMQFLLRTGYIGKIYGAQLIRSRVIAPGTVYVCGEREYFGRMPVRTELTVINADRPDLIMVGYSIFEQVGFLCYNFLSSQRIIIRGRTAA